MWFVPLCRNYQHVVPCSECWLELQGLHCPAIVQRVVLSLTVAVVKVQVLEGVECWKLLIDQQCWQAAHTGTSRGHLCLRSVTGLLGGGGGWQ